jgi:hypothetical protein
MHKPECPLCKEYLDDKNIIVHPKMNDVKETKIEALVD